MPGGKKYKSFLKTDQHLSIWKSARFCKIYKNFGEVYSWASLETLRCFMYLAYTHTQRTRLCTLWVTSVCAKSLQSCLTLCDPVDYSPPGSSIHGILQARILICGSHFPLQGFFPTQGSNPHLPCLLHWQMSSLPPGPPGSPSDFWYLHNFQLCYYIYKKKMSSSRSCSWNYGRMISKSVIQKCRRSV